MLWEGKLESTLRVIFAVSGQICPPISDVFRVEFTVIEDWFLQNIIIVFKLLLSYVGLVVQRNNILVLSLMFLMCFLHLHDWNWRFKYLTALWKKMTFQSKSGLDGTLLDANNLFGGALWAEDVLIRLLAANRLTCSGSNLNWHAKVVLRAESDCFLLLLFQVIPLVLRYSFEFGLKVLLHSVWNESVHNLSVLNVLAYQWFASHLNECSILRLQRCCNF